jgi:hypothetical protein
VKRRHWARLAWALTIAWIALLLLSLRTGWLDHFFYDTDQLPAPGIDFFSVERGWYSLLAGHSEYDTFRTDYGPYATWLNYHPLLAAVVGPVLMPFTPFVAYIVWTGISALLMAVAAWVLARKEDALYRAGVMLLLLGAFPTFIMFQSGNMQAILVLSVALVFAALRNIAEDASRKVCQTLLLAGLLMSLFSKPIVLAMLPLLLLMRETRRTALGASGIYLTISLLSLVVPAWNPEPLTWHSRWMWISHPDAIASTMNVYTNHFTVTAPMRDNAVHWFAMLGITDFRFFHVDIYSLSTLLDGCLRTTTPSVLYRVPILLVLETSVLVALIREHRTRVEAALMVTMAASLLLILSYGVVWEYHYTLLLPVGAVCLLLKSRSVLVRLIPLLSVFAWLPSLYVLIRTHDLQQPGLQNFLRAERVLPVLAAFLLLLAEAVRLAVRDTSHLRFFSRRAKTSHVHS